MFIHNVRGEVVVASAHYYLVEMEAIDFKAEAQRLQRQSRYEEALPLMLHSVALRENSHALCLSLSELTFLYLDMLKFDEADATSRRMLAVAHRYDEANQRMDAQAYLEHSARERKLDLIHGVSVRLHLVTQRPDLNGKDGVINGKMKKSGLYLVTVGSKVFAMPRYQFILQADRIVQLCVPQQQSECWTFYGTGIDGHKLAPVQLGHDQLEIDQLRKQFAIQLGCQTSVLKLMLPNGVIIQDGPLDQLFLQLQSEQAEVEGLTEATLSNDSSTSIATVVASNMEFASQLCQIGQ